MTCTARRIARRAEVAAAAEEAHPRRPSCASLHGVLPLLLIALMSAGVPSEGRPLFYWGARPPVIEARHDGPASIEARVIEVHAARDGADLVVRLTFDRPVRTALHLPNGTPVSGRLRASLDLDTDDDRRTGFVGGAKDLRTGANLRLELGAIAMGADPEEKRPASALVAATLFSLTSEGRRRTLWRSDDSADPRRISAHDDGVEVRIPGSLAKAGPRTRLILTDAEGAWDGRLPEGPRQK